MTKYTTLLLVVLASTLLAASCKKTETQLTELQKLPPATQTGANTFGCIVNGKAWVAQRNDCNIFCDPSFKVVYDPINGGNLSIEAIFIDLSPGRDQGILIGLDSTNFKRQFGYAPNSQSIGFTFINSLNFTRSWDSLVACTGSINLTTYDLQNRIVAGLFEFTLTKPNTEAIVVTSGRFDKRL